MKKIIQLDIIFRSVGTQGHAQYILWSTSPPISPNCPRQEKKIGFSAFFLFFLRHCSEAFLFYFLRHIARNFCWYSLSETTRKWWTIKVKKAPRRLNKIETCVPNNCNKHINIYHNPNHCGTIYFLLFIDLFFSSDMQKLENVFPPTVLGKQLFILIFFPPTLQKTPCRDPSTIEYTEHGPTL